MKHLNLDPELEKRKTEIMRQFNEKEPSPDAAADNELDENNESAATNDSGPPSAQVLKDRVIDALKTVYDPEIPVNIYDLGLIYRVDIVNNCADIDMTLTTPGCPVAQTFPGMVESAVKLVPGVNDAHVSLVWDPPWTQAQISEAARLELGLI